MCTNSSLIWKKLDRNNKLTFESFRDLDEYPEGMEKSLHVYHRNRWFKGYNAVIEIVKLLPALWILLPCLYIGKCLGFGEVIYQKIAENRELIPVNQCKDGEQCILTPNQHSYSSPVKYSADSDE